MDTSSFPQKNEFMSVPAFDYEKALQRVHQKHELLKRVVAIFKKNLSEKKALIETELSNENWDSLKMLSHSIKGSAWTIGAQQLGDVAYAMENATDDKNHPLMRHLFQIFLDCVDLFLEALDPDLTIS